MFCLLQKCIVSHLQWVDVEADDEEALMRALLHTLRLHSSASLPSSIPPAVIFTSTRSACEQTAAFLCSAGFSAAALHGGCSLQHILHQQHLLYTREISCVGKSFIRQPDPLKIVFMPHAPPITIDSE
jgi:superfamily II DNA/RNA helicase